MVVYQVISVFYAIFEVIGLPGSLLVIVTVALELRFHVMRYILLASLALSDFLFLIFVPSFRIASMVQERWLFGETMCYLNPTFVRYFYFNTVLHLIAVSYNRYHAIVKSPLTYDGTISTSKVAFIIIIWTVPLPFCIAPFLGAARLFVYNPLLFYCEERLWSLQPTSQNTSEAMIFAILMFVVPLLIIAFLNWSVYKTAKTQINALKIQVESLSGLKESQQQEITRRKKERRAANDVYMIVVAFFLCFLPPWISGLLRRFVRSVEIPAEVILITHGSFIFSSVCNPAIYSIRKRDFRTSVKNLLRQIGQFGGDSNVIGVNN